MEMRCDSLTNIDEQSPFFLSFICNIIIAIMHYVRLSERDVVIANGCHTHPAHLIFIHQPAQQHSTRIVHPFFTDDISRQCSSAVD